MEQVLGVLLGEVPQSPVIVGGVGQEFDDGDVDRVAGLWSSRPAAATTAPAPVPQPQPQVVQTFNFGPGTTFHVGGDVVQGSKHEEHHHHRSERPGSKRDKTT